MYLIVIGVIVLVLVILILSLYLNALWMKKKTMYKSDKRLDQKTVLITGGTAGIGLEIAKDLAKRGARLIVACPFIDEGNHGRNIIMESTGNKNVKFELLDLASFKSVREFAERILNSEDRLDILINNAGIAHTDGMTEDGINKTLQINYFGHFLLTILLLPLLIKTGIPEDKARIINVSSVMHNVPCISDLRKLHEYHIILGCVIMYPKSKLCILWFTLELAKRLRGTNVVVNSVNPGAAGTRFFGKYLKVVIDVFYKTAVEAAQVSIYAAVDDETGKSSGKYFRDNKAVKAKRIAYNSKKASELWDLSVKTTKLDHNQFINNLDHKHYLAADSGELYHVSCHV